MKKNKVRIIGILLVISTLFTTAASCDNGEQSGTKVDKNTTKQAANKLQTNQPTPSDIDYSLERYNLIRRAYWVNGQREKAQTLPNPIADMPLGYAVLLTENGSVLGKFIVSGKVSSLNSYLTPDSEYFEIVTGSTATEYNEWLPDIDGSYGSNDDGIFFFTPDGKYIEWTGTYLYSDIPFEVKDPMLIVSEK